MKGESTNVKERTVFVSGLPYETSQAELEELFSECGTITHINVPKYQDSQRNLGYAHITFSDAAEAKEALKLRRKTIGTRYIDVQPAKGEKPKVIPTDIPKDEITRTIFIKNLPYELTEDELGDAFRHCGEIENVRMIYNSVHKHFKGFAYIDFKKPEASKKALEMNGKEVKGRSIVVDFERKERKAGYRLNIEGEGNTKYNNEAKQIIHKKISKQRKQDEVSKIKTLTHKKKKAVQNDEEEND